MSELPEWQLGLTSAVAGDMGLVSVPCVWFKVAEVERRLEHHRVKGRAFVCNDQGIQGLAVVTTILEARVETSDKFVRAYLEQEGYAFPNAHIEDLLGPEAGFVSYREPFQAARLLEGRIAEFEDLLGAWEVLTKVSEAEEGQPIQGQAAWAERG